MSLATAILVTACAAPQTAAPSPTPLYTYDLSTPQPTASRAPAMFAPVTAPAVDANCGATAVVQGDIPDTLVTWAGHNAPTGLPYAVARPAIAAAFLFGYPLHVRAAGASATNKILWVVGTARTGDLAIQGTPLGRSAPIDLLYR